MRNTRLLSIVVAAGLLSLAGCGNAATNQSEPASPVTSSSSPSTGPSSSRPSSSTSGPSINPTSTIDATSAPTMAQSQRQVPSGANATPPAAPQWKPGDESKARDTARRALEAFGAGGDKAAWKKSLDLLLTADASNALSTIQNPHAIKFTLRGAGQLEQQTKTEYTVWITFKTSRGPWSVQVMRNAAFPDWKVNEIIPASARS